MATRWQSYRGWRHVYTSPFLGFPVYTVAWSPDSQRIASGDKSGTVRIWPITLIEDNHGFKFPSNAVQAVAWSPNGKYIASGGMEATVQVWNAKL